MSITGNPELEEWIELLQSPDLSDRLVAIKTLQHLGDEQVIDVILAALNDESAAVQKIAIASVWELANPKVVPHLIPHLGSTDEEIRTLTLSALGELVSQDSQLLLLDALQVNNVPNDIHSVFIQRNILILLRKIHDAQCLPYLLPFLESEHAELREAAITTLRYLNQVKTSPNAIGLLKDPIDFVRREAALTLGYLTDSQVIPSLIKALKEDPDWQVRRNVTKALAIHGNDGAIPALIEAIADEHWQVRRFAAQALQKIFQTVKTEIAIPALIRALADEYADVRKDVVIALATLGSPLAIAPLKQMLDDPDREVSIQAKGAMEKITIHEEIKEIHDY
ncbi:MULTISPECIES: HEAT repeat domain-containing protein [Cylindrospermopsis]|uniref:HEAT repeat domain-containing protein n=1 Tax=Cylindrospermopsis curvispora GIHE-G1 TaxID=2666332 RepID=A0A7H0F413_9CYAN|nr:HEAT repeat domain-containing protein [Cylindrospermopsis curvispora]QNP30779.1 HEAT repeat domain-containing protein [Cylindrospermopsis curvispora GIHE-G1]